MTDAAVHTPGSFSADTPPPALAMGRLVLLVRDFEEAIAFYRDRLGFEVFVDTGTPPDRFVHIRLASQPEFGLWLIEAQSPEQQARVGNQTGGQPLAVLYTPHLAAEQARLQGRGVRFVRAPASDGTARFAHFADLYGNEFVLVELLAH